MGGRKRNDKGTNEPLSINSFDKNDMVYVILRCVHLSYVCHSDCNDVLKPSATVENVSVPRAICFLNMFFIYKKPLNRHKLPRSE